MTALSDTQVEAIIEDHLTEYASVRAAYNGGYLAGLIAASNAAATEHESIGWEGAVRAIEERINRERKRTDIQES